MFIDLVDTLRCVEPHEESWLVASFDEMDGRVIVRGTLGCPVCRRRYRVVDRVVWLGMDPDSAGPPLSVVSDEADESGDEVTRLAALLGLAEPGGLCVLEGRWAMLAPALLALLDTRVLALNPAAPLLPAEGISVLRTPDTLPLAASVARGVALGERADRAQHSLTTVAVGAVHALARGGRLLAPAALALPAGVQELARDERHWVGERLGPESAPIKLRVVRGR